MQCIQCGRGLEYQRTCPYCGAEQYYADPFVSLGDLTPSESIKNKKNLDTIPLTPSESEQYFSKLGDLGYEDTFLEEDAYCERVDIYTENSYVDHFHHMGNLDGSAVSGGNRAQGELNDEFGYNGFRPMDDLVPTDGGKKKPDFYRERNRFSVSNPFRYVTNKKRIAIIVSCTAIFCLIICAVFVNSLGSSFSAGTAEDIMEQVLRVSISEVSSESIETPVFLFSIESRNGYEILSVDKTETGAVTTMRVFAPDVYGVAKKMDSSKVYTDEKVLYAELDNAIRTAPLVEKQVVVEYVLTDDGYEPVLTSEFLDAYYGGIYQLRDEVIANITAGG